MNSSDVHSVQSRLKHRKILGMGAGADGSVPRSKISQLLGNESINDFVIEKKEFPKGLCYFQWLICMLFGTVGLVNIVWPQHFYRSATASLSDPSSLVRQVADDLKDKIDDFALLDDASNKETKIQILESHFHQLENSLVMLDIPVRLYGTACLSLSALFFIVAIINKDNRRAIRIALAVQATYFAIDILVTWWVTNPLSTANTSWFTDPVSMFWVTIYKFAGIVLSIYYYIKTHPNVAKPWERGYVKD